MLHSMNLDYEIISDSTADIFASISITQLALALAKENCELLSVQEKDENLEGYYLSLVGGECNA